MRSAAYMLLTEGHSRIFEYTFEEFLQAIEISAKSKESQYKLQVAAMMNAVGLMFSESSERDKFFRNIGI